MEYIGCEKYPRKQQPEEDPEQTIRGMPASMYANYLKEIPAFLTPRQRELADAWLEMGRAYAPIRKAQNPPFDLGSFTWWENLEGQSLHDVCRQIHSYRTHPGNAVVVGDICFMYRSDGQWLVFKAMTGLGTLTMPTEDTAFQEVKARIARIVKQIRMVGTLADCINSLSS